MTRDFIVTREQATMKPSEVCKDAAGSPDHGLFILSNKAFFHMV